MIVGDADGVVVISRHLAPEVADAAFQQERYDLFALEEIRAGKSLFGSYPPDEDARRRYLEWLKQQQLLRALVSNRRYCCRVIADSGGVPERVRPGRSRQRRHWPIKFVTNQQLCKGTIDRTNSFLH